MSFVATDFPFFAFSSLFFFFFFFSFLSSFDLALRCLFLIETKQRDCGRSENVTTGDNRVAMKERECVVQVCHVMGEQVVAGGQGCNHFLKTDFSEFLVGGCGLASIPRRLFPLHAVYRDLCVPISCYIEHARFRFVLWGM